MEDSRFDSRSADPWAEIGFGQDFADGLRTKLPDSRETPETDLRFIQWFDLPVDRSSAWQSFVVPEGSVGFILYAAARTPGFWVSFELRGPGGESLHCRRCEDPPAVGEQKLGRGSIQLPSTDRPGGEVVPGVYQFRVNALPVASPSEEAPPPGTAVDVLAAVRSEAADLVERLLDLNFVYLPGIPLSKDLAESMPEFDTMLALTQEKMAPLGIRFGNVTHVDLDEPEFTHLGSRGEAGLLFASTSKQVGRPRALNVYCVGLFDEDLLNVAGISGGIPGAAVNGTRESGIGLRIAPSFPNFLDAYAVLFAHEIGHYLGFYHTTEANLQRADPLSDTPRCDEPDLYACPDWSYHMFPIANVSMDTWSPSQIGIAPTHPLVRTVPAPGALARREGAAAGAAGTAARLRARPNPFADVVQLDAPGAGSGGGAGTRAAVDVFDVAGRRLRTLGAQDAAGWTWDGRDASGTRVPAGVYFVRLRGDSGSPVVRLVRSP